MLPNQISERIKRKKGYISRLELEETQIESHIKTGNPHTHTYRLLISLPAEDIQKQLCAHAVKLKLLSE